MGSIACILLIFCIILQVFVLNSAQSQDNTINITCNFDKSVGTYSASSSFEKNIQAIPSFWNSTDKTFYSFSVGNEPDTVNVIALCRGDLDATMCQRCLNLSYNELTTNCNREKESIIWKDECMLRYSNRAIFNTMSSVPNITIDNSTKASDPNDLNKKVKNMLAQLRNQAADHGSSLIKFATANISVDGNTVFGLVQCTPDLTNKDCKACLDGTFDKLPSCCGGNVGARYLTPSCNFRYETGVTAFYYNTNADIRITGGKGKKKKTITIVVIVLSASCIVVYMYTREDKKPGDIEDDTNEELDTEESLHFDLETVKVATNDFSDDNKLGRGGFGVVYKGTLLDGTEIAVKRLLQNSQQHELEFKTEVSLLAKLQHRNLLRLLGYSLKGAERLLIYEFIANGSLDNYIEFDKEKRFNLDADTRIKIVKGVARGLLYLHEDSRLRIIHRDLKPSNILLDEEMHPKIADFGMARLFEFDKTQATTKHVVGTYGYIAPEYVKLGHFSDKSDVYSFGVVVLEIITGKKKNFQNGEAIEYLPSYVWKNWQDGRVLDVIDPILRDGSDLTNEMTRCVHIALLCVQESVANRPTMASVLLMLSSAFIVLPAPSEAETHSSSSNSENPPLISSSNQASVTELTGR